MKATCNGFCRAHNILYPKSAHSLKFWLRHTIWSRGGRRPLVRFGTQKWPRVPTLRGGQSPSSSQSAHSRSTSPSWGGTEELFQLCDAGLAQAANGDPHKQTIVGSRLGLPLAITSDLLRNILCSASLRRPWATFS